MKTKEVTYDENEILSGEGELNIDEVFDLIDEFTWNNHSFISIVLNEINVFQLAYCNDKFMAEITNDSPDMIFHQKYATEYEVKEMIKYFYEDGDFIAIDENKNVYIITHDPFDIKILSDNLLDILKK